MRAAIFSDVHGNVRALDTVLADAASCGVDEHWIVGDVASHGPRPAETAQRIRALPCARVVRGNTDRYALTGEMSAIIPSDDWPLRMEVARHSGWTLGAITAVGAADWLDSLPLELRLEVPSGERVLLVHAAPGTDDGQGLYPELTDDELSDVVRDAGAHLIFAGHTHRWMDRTVDGVRVVNVGSVSNPRTPSTPSTWTLLTADADDYTLEHRTCPFDVEGFCADVDRMRDPSPGWLKGRLGR